MLTVTDNACAHLSELLTGADAPSEVAVRLVQQADGLALDLDSERPGDTSYSHEGKTVLVLDEDTSTMLTDRTLDLQDTAEGPRLGLC